MGLANEKLVRLFHRRLYQTLRHSTSRKDHQDILSQMQLFLVDEVKLSLASVFPLWLTSLHFASYQVHILHESRGATLEVCLSRMKTRGKSVRFVLVSATAPNIEDIAAWIGSATTAQDAAVFKVIFTNLPSPPPSY
jgi:ATP-dependent DNA helicase HFM1/MER3